jgi:hypothetical protein
VVTGTRTRKNVSDGKYWLLIRARLENFDVVEDVKFLASRRNLQIDRKVAEIALNRRELLQWMAGASFALAL